MECGTWGTVALAGEVSIGGGGNGSGGGQFTAARTTETVRGGIAREAARLGDVVATTDARMSTGLSELDRVFGGGVVAGSVTLLGGEPGIGKSTIALMACSAIAERGLKALYVSGEESAAQVKMRAERLKAGSRVLFLGLTDVADIAATVAKERPAIVVIDSVQTLTIADNPADAGAVSQVRGAASTLVQVAKSSNVPMIIIGHVTKDGNVAGPKTLEHLVDAVFSFEGERSHPLRVLRALKNRFGTTDECGMFSMEGVGLVELKNPSGYLLDERRGDIPGSVISCTTSGTRPMLVEIQALVQKSSFGYPVRRASGFDHERLEMLIAIVSRRGGVALQEQDVFVNVVGGVKLRDPAADLAVALAIISAARGVALPRGMAVWGELGLGGEVRRVQSADRRLAEAKNLGMDQVVCPSAGKTKGVGTLLEASMQVFAAEKTLA